jgi:integral membrane protein (TIGR00529 family)
MEIPAIAKILITFFVVLLTSRFKVPLGLGLIGGGIFLELWAGRAATVVSGDVLTAFLRPDLWLLLINITLIIEFGYFLSSEKNSKIIINAAQGIGGSKAYAISLILIPATIGLVPMPGGALFSAPLIKQTADRTTRPAAWKAAVNYWFRHILEYWWPLYPVAIVTLSIFAIEPWQYMATMAPFTLVSIAAGYFFLLRGTSHIDVEESKGDYKGLVMLLAPILLIVFSTLLLPFLLNFMMPDTGSSVVKMVAMLIGLIGGLLLIAGPLSQAGDRKLFANLFTMKTGTVLLTLTGVMVFQTLLERSTLLPLAARELTSSNISLGLIIAILPFVAGLVTGIAVGFAGTAFPVVAGLVSTDPGSPVLATLILSFIMGYCGMMLSPVHLCFVLTKDYFSAPFLQVYRYLFPCVITIMATGSCMYLLFRFLGW